MKAACRNIKRCISVITVTTDPRYFNFMGHIDKNNPTKLCVFIPRGSHCFSKRGAVSHCCRVPSILACLINIPKEEEIILPVTFIIHTRSWHLTTSIFCLNIFVFYGLDASIGTNSPFCSSSSNCPVSIYNAPDKGRILQAITLRAERSTRARATRALQFPVPRRRILLVAKSHKKYAAMPVPLPAEVLALPIPSFPLPISCYESKLKYTKTAHKSWWLPLLTELLIMLLKGIKSLSSSFQCWEKETQDVLYSRVYSNSR